MFKRTLLTALCFLGALGCQRDQPISLGLQATTALHEAAHAVVGLTASPDNYRVDLIAVATRVSKRDVSLGRSRYLYRPSRTPNLSVNIAMAAEALAGAEAEKILLGLNPTGFRQDLREAAAYCQRPCQGDRNESCQTIFQLSDGRIAHSPIEACMKEANLLAGKLVAEHGLAILGLAELVMKQEPNRWSGERRLYAATVREFLRHAGLNIAP